jgi:hypothetical protein
MGVRFPGSGNTTLVAASVVTTAETVVLTSNLINLALDFEQVLIFWWLSITTAANTTGIKWLLRRGAAVASTLINVNVTEAIAASTLVTRGGCYVDTPGAVAGLQYSLTVTCVAASANATVNDGCIALVGL